MAQAIGELARSRASATSTPSTLVHAGFLTLEGILAADLGDLAEVEGFDAETAKAVHEAAEAAYEKEHGAMES